MLAHPLTETRRPPLTHTSARATPDGWILQKSSGTAVSASSAMAAAAQGRFHRFISISFPANLCVAAPRCPDRELEYISAGCDNGPVFVCQIPVCRAGAARLWDLLIEHSQPASDHAYCLRCKAF
jgi:hypothetical protein